MPDLRLDARDFADLTRWRWVLTEPSGVFIADHEVRLDASCWQNEAFTDLHGYMWHAAPDRFAEDEARIVADVGAWIGSQVLGPVAEALARRRPATVRVVVPEGAEALLFRPPELAHANGKPLAVQDVTLVMQPGTGDVYGGVAPVGDRLRVLGLFSLPEGGQPLNLRQERYSLVRLLHQINAPGKAADVRVLQYGVTRDRLQGVLEEAEGWDVIHISGHGVPGELLLETAAGRPDRVSAAELADMLDLARERIKLVTVSACWSAATVADQQRRLLGLPVLDQRTADRPAGDGKSAPGALATELAERLGCAVLAMRYPVDDEFAIALSGKLYELLVDRGQPLPRAVGMTLKHLMGEPGGASFPALSVAAPALFGATAAGLRLAAPDRTQPAKYDTGALKMAGFPPQPERFVGRTGVMARASAALAAQSTVPGVLLHGMPGSGKTACALELAYGHEHAFESLVWFKAPDEGMDITGALTDFALTLERDLPGFQMIGVLTDENKLAGFLPRLTEQQEQRRILIVIDNTESLLTGSGEWRDHRWGQVVSALTSHTGQGRVIVTSRVPVEIAGLRAEAVGTLPAGEALLLARELPHLRALIRGDLPGLGRDVARQLALGVLTIAQGHPKLLELADGQATNPERLTALIEAGGQAWQDQGGLPDGFFTTGETTATAGDYLRLLAAWTEAVAATLSPAERDLFWFLCCLEEFDRERLIIESIWERLWQRLGRNGQSPRLDQALTAITTAGLAARGEDRDRSIEFYAIHPGVAAAGRARAGQPFHDAVDAEAAAYWVAMLRHANGETGDAGINTRLLVRAGLSIVPYLTRQAQWRRAADLLDLAFSADPSRSNAAAMLPAIQQITGRDPDATDVLAKILRVIDPDSAEAQFLAYLDTAVTRRDYRSASRAAGQLLRMFLHSGQLTEALAMANQKADYSRQAGLGPWTKLQVKVERLQILRAMGQHDQILADVQQLRNSMATLDPAPSQDETTHSWSVREMLLDTGRAAATSLGLWEETLDLNTAVIASMRDRHAPATEIARSRFNDYGPMLQLGYTAQALNLLLECRQDFEEAGDIRMLGMTLGALAHVEDTRGHGDDAIRMQCDALRYSYLDGSAVTIATCYMNLGIYLYDHARQAVPALASFLTAALIFTCAGAGAGEIGMPTENAAGALRTLREIGTEAVPPADMAGLCRQLGDIPGTDPAHLIAKLSPDPETADRALRNLIAEAQKLADNPPEPNPEKRTK